MATRVHNLPRMARRRVCRTSVGSILLVAVIAALSTSAARADGDPASDYLLTNQVFLTSQSATVSPAQRQLLAVVRTANHAGFAIRVAVISSEYDLGSITALWQRPTVYARFLGLELSSAYRQRLLVVMPDGLGFNWPGHPTTSAYRTLTTLPPASGSDGLALAAQRAIRRLAGADGVRIGPLRSSVAGPSSRSTARSTGDTVLVIAGAALGGLVLMALLAAGARALLRRRSRRARPVPPGRLRGRPNGMRWAVPGIVAVCGAAVAVPILAVHRSANSSASAASVVTPPPFSWPAGRRPAPDFALRDQNGGPVSLARYRGRPLIVTFIDPLCRNLCPLEAQVLNEAERRLPVSRRPVVLAVSVDVWANSRADLMQDVHQWHLVPEWRWAIGRPSQLAAVWSRYEIGVRVITKRIAGTTINYITHTEAAYIVDPTGHERALFLWPFYPQDVARVLRRLA